MAVQTRSTKLGAMTVALVIFALITLILLFGAIPINGEIRTGIFASPVLIVLFVSLSGSLAFCSWKRRAQWKRIGFHFAHLGIILVLTGFLVSWIWGTSATFSIPIGFTTDRIPIAEKKMAQLGFSFAVRDFSVEYHPPLYGVYEQESTGAGKARYEYSRQADASGIDIDGYGRVPASKLTDPKDARIWLSNVELENGPTLKIERLTPRLFRAAIEYFAKGDEIKKANLAVNHPLEYGGWKLYLSSYDRDKGEYVVLAAYNEPGRSVVIGGIWIVIAGIFIICFAENGIFKRARREEA
jgi:hypothetical protein